MTENTDTLSPEVLADLKAKALKAKAAYAAYEANDSVENYNATEAADIALVEDRSFHDVILSLLTALEEAEGRIEDLTNKLDDALHDYGNAESEAKGAEADIADLTARAEKAEQQVAVYENLLISLRSSQGQRTQARIDAALSHNKSEADSNV